MAADNPSRRGEKGKEKEKRSLKQKHHRGYGELDNPPTQRSTGSDKDNQKHEEMEIGDQLSVGGKKRGWGGRGRIAVGKTQFHP